MGAKSVHRTADSFGLKRADSSVSKVFRPERGAMQSVGNEADRGNRMTLEGYEGSHEQRTARMVAARVDSFFARLDRELADAGKDKQAGEVWNWRGVPRIGPDALPLGD